MNPTTGLFEYADVKIRELREKRKQLNNRNDPWEYKQSTIKHDLKEIGLPVDQMGKTGDSKTGKISEEQKKIAESQIEDAKLVMLYDRNKCR